MENLFSGLSVNVPAASDPIPTTVASDHPPTNPNNLSAFSFLSVVSQAPVAEYSTPPVQPPVTPTETGAISPRTAGSSVPASASNAGSPNRKYLSQQSQVSAASGNAVETQQSVSTTGPLGPASRTTHPSLSSSAVPFKTSAFGFLSSNQTPPPAPPPARDSELPRKKTRKANVPGYAGREQLAAQENALAVAQAQIQQSAQQSYSSGVSTSSPRNLSERDREQDLSVSSAVPSVREFLEEKHYSPRSPITTAVTRAQGKPPSPSQLNLDERSSARIPQSAWNSTANGATKPPPPAPRSSTEDIPYYEQSKTVSDFKADNSSSPYDAARYNASKIASQGMNEQPPPPPSEPDSAPRSPEPFIANEESLAECTDLNSVQAWTRRMDEDMSTRKRRLLDAQALCHADMQRYQEEVTRLQKKLDETVAEQNSLCDQDKFLEAEALDVRIREMKHKLSKTMQEITNSRKQRGSIICSLSEATTDHLMRLERCFVRMKELQAEALGNFEERDFALRRQMASETNRLNSELERISLARKHLEKDIANAEEERQQVEAALETQTKTYRDELRVAAEQVGILDFEIKALEQEIAQKKKQKQQSEEVVVSCQSKVASVKTKFEKQLTRLADADRRIAEATAEVDADREAVEQAQMELEIQRKNTEAQERGRKQDLARLKRLQSSIHRQVEYTKKHHKQRERWKRKRLPFEASLSEKRENLDVFREHVERLAADLQTRHNEGAGLKSQLEAIEFSLPQLEANKKLAVTSRSFKEAGRVAAEIKRLEEDKTRIRKELETGTDELADLQSNFEKAQNEEREKQEELRKAEAEYDMKEIKILEKQVKDILLLSERAQKKGHLEARRLFHTEIEICNMCITHLVQKHAVEVSSISEVEWSEESDLNDSPNQSSDEGSNAGSRRASLASIDDAEIIEEEHVEEAVCEEDGIDDDLRSMNTYELTALETEYRLRVEDAINEMNLMEKQIDEFVETENYEEAECKEQERTAIGESLELLKLELERIEKVIRRKENGTETSEQRNSPGSINECAPSQHDASTPVSPPPPTEGQAPPKAGSTRASDALNAEQEEEKEAAFSPPTRGSSSTAPPPPPPPPPPPLPRPDAPYSLDAMDATSAQDKRGDVIKEGTDTDAEYERVSQDGATTRMMEGTHHKILTDDRGSNGPLEDSGLNGPADDPTPTPLFAGLTEAQQHKVVSDIRDGFIEETIVSENDHALYTDHTTRTDELGGGGGQSMKNQEPGEVVPVPVPVRDMDEISELYRECVEKQCPLPRGFHASVVRAALARWEADKSILALADAVYKATKEAHQV